MKKLILCPLLSVLSVFLLVGSVMAYPYMEVEGFVHPGSSIASWTDNGDGTTTILGLQYQFFVTAADSGAKMDFLSLEFEGDVFTSVGNLQFVNPTDWTSYLLTSSGSNMYEIASAGTTLGVGEQLEFLVDVTMYTESLTSVSGDFNGDGIAEEAWTEGQIWGQSWKSGDTLGGGDGGSTTPSPEPATMLLLGSGLVGLGVFGRKRYIKRG